MAEPKRDVGSEILTGLAELKRGQRGRIVLVEKPRTRRKKRRLKKR